MNVTVKLFATLRDYLPEDSDNGACRLSLSEGETVKDVLRRLRVPEDIKLVLLLNSRHTDYETELAEGDVLSVFPPIAGG
jgi:molybdopterin converting factor small subunit